MKIALMLFVFLASAAMADTGTTNQPTSPASGYIEKFEVPERDEAGNLKWKLNGDRAVLRPDGLMDIINARAEFYQSNQVALVFTSARCLLDRVNSRGATDAPVRVERDNMILTGIGGEWDGAKSTLTIHTNVQMIIKSGRMFTPQGTKP
jgi:hypothetical protein